MTVENSSDWDEIVKKEARGALDNSDFGEVQQVGRNWICTQKGLISKDKFYFPKYLVKGFDGDKVWIDASENDLDKWKREEEPSYEEYSQYRDTSPRKQVSSDIETRIPLMKEGIQKTSTSDDVVVRKEQVTEMVETPVTHEELRVEKKPGTKVTEEKE